MLEFRAHYSGSGGNFYTLHDGTAHLGLDPGVPYKKLQSAVWGMGLKVTDFDGFLLSHSHQDHCMSAAPLLRAAQNCYASRETWAALKINHHRARLMWAGMGIGPWRVRSFETDHDAPGCLGFLIEGPSRETCVYLCDAPYSRHTFPPCEIYALECNFSQEIIRENVMAGSISTDRFKRTTSSHMSVERLVDLLRANDLSQTRAVYLMHLSAMNSSAEDFRDQVRRATGVATYVCAEHGGVMEFA